ncbi:MAG: WbqC family protein [Flavobacterium sp.]|nr:WbqC family protein [Flavobacterium sp.]
MANKKVAVMQPYVFPYIGYFQLIQSVDTFVFYDDVNFIKKGWINRNNLLINKEKQIVTFPCKGISQNKEIREIEINKDDKAYQKIIRTIELAYKGAPYFENIFPLIETVIVSDNLTISELAVSSIEAVMEYLEIPKNFKLSSDSHSNSKGQPRADRLIAITKSEGGSNYINAAGGIELYDKADFEKHGIELQFLMPELPEYKQWGDSFVPGLSIIDILMFNDVPSVQAMLNNYSLI